MDALAQSPATQRLRRRTLGTLFIQRILKNLSCGSLTVTLPDGTSLHHRAATNGPDATLHLHRWRMLRRLLLGGDIACAESFIDHDWTTPDLTALLELAALNQPAIPGANGGTLPARLLHRLRHRARRNTPEGSRRNIVEHYDLGNDFYRSWLDSGMSYSSALFSPDTEDLETAQTAKHDRILDLLDLTPGQRVLEVGFGWGSIAERVAAAGCHLTGLTLSPAQQQYAQQRLQSAGLAEQCDLRLQDYRDIDGQFDRIVSIEMLEAVGEAWWPAYFAMLRRRLAPGGSIVLQCITIADARFADYRRNTDFIQQHVFPGGMLPSPSALKTQIERAGLKLENVEMFGPSYARTLAAWQHRFHAAWPDIAVMGFTFRFRRLWDYYLSYCQAGFRTGAIDVGFWRLTHP